MAGDLKKFFAFYVLVGLVFTMMVFIAVNNTDVWNPHIGETMNTLLLWMMGEYNVDTLDVLESDVYVVIIALFWMWVMFSNVLMLNILIAMFGTTFSSIHDDAEAVAHYRKCLLILRMEAVSHDDKIADGYVERLIAIQDRGEEQDNSIGENHRTNAQQELFNWVQACTEAVSQKVDTLAKHGVIDGDGSRRSERVKRTYAYIKSEIESEKNIQTEVDVISDSCSEEIMDKVLACPKFLKWMQNIDRKHHLISSVTIRDVVMFGPKPGFILAQAALKDRDTGMEVPGCVFIRGASVCIFVLLQDSATGQMFMVITEQYRAPVGGFIREVPAGMLDERTGDFKGVAASELQEELDITINQSELKHLGQFWPSPGGCDENIDCYLLHRTVSSADIAEMNGKITGKFEENEHIKLVIIPLTIEAVLSLRDAKAAYALLQFLHKEKLVQNDLSGHRPSMIDDSGNTAGL